MLFHDRTDAGRQLAQALSPYKKEDCVVLALPRGGVPVAKEVARALRAPLELVLVRKIGAPHQPELAVGAIVDGSGPIIVRNESVMRALGVRQEEFDTICRRELDEIERRRAYYLQGHSPVSPAGRVAIVIDDGIATGATTRAALEATRRRAPKKLVLAVPVASRDAIESLSEDADEIVCLATPEPFDSVGRFYDDFDQLTHQQVRVLMAEAAKANADTKV
jgi:putative phosphoribosyl transferase